ncbi:MAG: Metal-dependent hydrolases of the beta-lactamase superfamily II [Promethearchaeota archaeon CR_4]|nr:MAG: Metal-dependent hydrolases of the beta-lactamase superfamily II [Candidatus Lokiarchaeota archaeon CR_4]
MVQNLVSPFLKYPGINYVSQPRLPVTKSIGEHGFAMLVDVKNGEGNHPEEVANTILWDTGSINCTILHNFKAWGRSFADIKVIGLSHGHFDHTGALLQVLKEIGHPVEIFAHPEVICNRYFSRSPRVKYDTLLGKSIQDIDQFLQSEEVFKSPGLVPSDIQEGGGLLKLAETPAVIFENTNYKIWTTGQVPREYPEENAKVFVYEKASILEDDQVLDDQSLVIERKEKADAIVLLGCCHAGLMNTVRWVESKTKSHIGLVIGGTHMESASPQRLAATFQFLRARIPVDIFPVHCSGAEFGVAINNLGVEGLRAYDASVFTQFFL